MATLDDPVKRQAYLDALSNWRFSGYIEFSDQSARWLRKNLPNWTLKGVKEKMYIYVNSGGEIDYQIERRHLEIKDERCIRDSRYDLRMPFEGRSIYFETVLLDDEPADMRIVVVNTHDA